MRTTSLVTSILLWCTGAGGFSDLFLEVPLFLIHIKRKFLPEFLCNYTYCPCDAMLGKDTTVINMAVATGRKHLASGSVSMERTGKAAWISKHTMHVMLSSIFYIHACSYSHVDAQISDVCIFIYWSTLLQSKSTKSKSKLNLIYPSIYLSIYLSIYNVMTIQGSSKLFYCIYNII